MTFRAGSFTSRATCTPRDLELEAEINKKLKVGKVSLFTMKDEHADFYGLTYSFRGLSKTVMRRTFDLDVDDVIEGLAITTHGMENAKLTPGWVYEEEDAARFPEWVEDLISGHS